MSQIGKIAPQKHSGDVDRLLAGIDQASYIDAIRNSCASFQATAVAETSAIDNVYLYARPEYVVAMAIGEGKDPYAALDEWLEAVGCMLTEYRKARRQSLLFEAVSAMRYCGVELPFESTSNDLALATLAVYQSGEIKPKLDELTASSIPLEGWNQPPQLNLDEIADQYRRSREETSGLATGNVRLKKELDQLEEEASKANDKLNSENQSLRDQVDRHREVISGQEDVTDQLKKRLAETESQCDVLNDERKELNEENELLLLQLHQVQEELEHYFYKLQDISRKTETNDLPQADSKPETSILKHPAKQKERSIFVRKIVAFMRLRSEAALLKSCQLFDAKWYLEQYPDVAAAKVDPARHYLRFGATEGRNPGPDFDTEMYLQRNPDVRESGLNPLVHYLKYGKEEGRMKTDWS